MSNGALIVLWHEMGKPEIPLGKGIDVHRLPTFLAHAITNGFTQEIEQCRRYLTGAHDG